MALRFISCNTHRKRKGRAVDANLHQDFNRNGYRRTDRCICRSKILILDRDVYRLGEGSTITVDEASCPPSTNVPSGGEGGCNGVLLVPAGLGIDLVRKELLDEQVADESGKTHKVPMKVSGTITVTERLLLKATGNTKHY